MKAYTTLFIEAYLEIRSRIWKVKLPEMVIDYFESFLKNQIITVSGNRLP